MSTKIKFNPYERCEEDWPISVGDNPDMPEIGIRRGYLILRRLSYHGIGLIHREDIKPIFTKVFNEILALIERQLREVTWRAKIKASIPIYPEVIILDCVSGWRARQKCVLGSVSSRETQARYKAARRWVCA